MIEILQGPDLRVPIKLWLPKEEIEPEAMQQLRNTANHPEAGSHIAVMPDCHVGYGVTVGCVFPTVNAVIPNAVGVDIGCGMSALDTGVTYDRELMNRNFWRAWSGDVARGVPTGFGKHARAQELGPLDRPLRARSLQPVIRERAAYQIGTLGGGNHFIEAQFDESDRIWLMVHSGSRHAGLRIAEHYAALAIASSERRKLQTVSELSSLPLDDPVGQDYLADMEWATDFALENRRRMMAVMSEAFWRLLDRYHIPHDATTPELINIHHNFARLEEHGGREVMIHRKGATSAFAGQIGIIPGSMGAQSYIVRGLGNEESFKSCSHGAGRKLGRGAAKRAISESEFVESLRGTYSKPSVKFIDEAPGAYKDIELVIQRQLDLIEVMHRLQPIITLKGETGG